MDRNGLEKVGPTVIASPLSAATPPHSGTGDHHYQIGSEDGQRSCEILNGHCQCSDYVRRGPGHPCMHRLALSLYHRLESSGPPQPPNRNADSLTPARRSANNGWS